MFSVTIRLQQVDTTRTLPSISSHAERLLAAVIEPIPIPILTPPDMPNEYV